jgi:hypothetical protein
MTKKKFADLRLMLCVNTDFHLIVYYHQHSKRAEESRLFNIIFLFSEKATYFWTQLDGTIPGRVARQNGQVGHLFKVFTRISVKLTFSVCCAYVVQYTVHAKIFFGIILYSRQILQLIINDNLVCACLSFSFFPS